MPHVGWVTGSGGLRGPHHLVEQAEWEIQGYLAAGEQGFDVTEQPEPLLTALLLASIAHWLRIRVRSWLVVPHGPADPRGRPFLVDD